MHFTSRRFSLPALLIAGLISTSALQAQQPQTPQMSQEQMQQIQALQQETQQLRQQVSQLQQQAMKNSEQLQTQSQEIQEMISAVMSDKGFDPDADMKRMDELKAEFGKPETDDKRKAEIQEEARKIQQNLQQAQGAAMADEDVKTAGAKLEEDLMAEMTKIDPEFPKMMEQLKANQQEMRNVMMSAQGKQ